MRRYGLTWISLFAVVFPRPLDRVNAESLPEDDVALEKSVDDLLDRSLA